MPAPLTRTLNRCRIMRVITRRNLEAALAVIETRLACESESLDLKADRARVLTELGQTDEAKSQYLEILNAIPGTSSR